VDRDGCCVISVVLSVVSVCDKCPHGSREGERPTRAGRECVSGQNNEIRDLSLQFLTDGLTIFLEPNPTSTTKQTKTKSKPKASPTVSRAGPW
jgi:hypothetical protein